MATTITEPLVFDSEEYRNEINTLVKQLRLSNYLATMLIQLISATKNGTERPRATPILLAQAKHKLSKGIILQRKKIHNVVENLYYDVMVLSPQDEKHFPCFYLCQKFIERNLIHIKDY